MGAVRAFPNVSDSFNLCEDEYDQTFVVHNYSDFELSPQDSQDSLDDAIARFGFEEAGEQSIYRGPGMESCLKSSEHRNWLDAPSSWQMGPQDWHPRDSLPEQLLYDLKIPSNRSARSAWTPFDQEASCSGGGSWSPHTTDSRSDAGGMFVQQQSSWESHRPGMTYIHAGGTLDFHANGSYHCSPTTKVISPQELEHHHDDYVDVYSPRTDLQVVGVGQAEYPEDTQCYPQHGCQEQYYTKDEGLGASIQSTKEGSNAPSVKDEDDMEEDAEHDDDEDWSPKVEKSGHGRRLSRRSTLTKPAPNVAKRPQRPNFPPTKAPKPTGIMKKQSIKHHVPAHSNARNTKLQPCEQCEMAFPSDSTLKKHVLATHSRPFVCTFHDYGCGSTVGSKNEWKRHINVQHMHLETWRCDIGACAVPAGAPEDSQQDGQNCRRISSHRIPSLAGQLDTDAATTHDFDRKDLFTQHMKRMHAPPATASRTEKQAFEAGIEEAQKRCYRKLRDPPINTICPFCPDRPKFETWDDRTEHVGKHLEKNDIDRNTEIEDPVLREWLRAEDYLEWKGQCWRLKDTGKKKKRTAVKKEEDEEDAEGEYVEER